MSATDAILRAAPGRDPGQPLVTYYDDATGERTELSATTLANWVAKTANLLRDDLMVEPGDRVAVALPAHWQTVAVALAVWDVGAVVTDSDTSTPVAVTVADAAYLERRQAAGAAPPEGEVLALSLAPLGRGLATPLPGVVDYAVEVRAHGDRFTPYQPVGDDEPALRLRETDLTVGELVARARDRSAQFGLTAADRVLSTLAWNGPADWFDGWLAVFAAGGSLVQCVNAPDADGQPVARRATAERATATIGNSVPDVRGLSR